MATGEALGVWLAGVKVAELTSTKPGEVRHAYTAEALDRWPRNIPLLSCSLPLAPGRRDARVFYAGLLPEGQHRQAMAAAANVAAYDTFGLLERFGRDVAGALVIGHDEPGKRPGSVEPYTEETLAEEVASLPDRPLGLHDDSELSIAGLQDKLLLVALPRGRWGRPVHGRPSTHILKVEDRRFPGMAAAEASTLSLAAAVGLTSIEPVVTTIADVPCLIVSRFDRVVGRSGVVRRVHQEDACQALDRDPDAANGRGKYEAAGGPALREVASLLDRYGADPEHELGRLAAVTAFTVCVGNADAHGKNLALLHPRPDTVELAPLYDTVPTQLWPRLRRDGAMTVNGRVRLAGIRLADVVAEARSWPLSSDLARDAAVRVGEGMLDALRDLDADAAFRSAVEQRTTDFLAGG